MGGWLRILPNGPAAFERRFQFFPFSTCVAFVARRFRRGHVREPVVGCVGVEVRDAAVVEDAVDFPARAREVLRLVGLAAIADREEQMPGAVEEEAAAVVNVARII